jgi:4-amino-4-deoxy-L-arabinose transferase-like glycosyltransferase
MLVPTEGAPGNAIASRSAWSRWTPRVLGGIVLAAAIALRIASFPVPERSPDELLWTKFGAGIAREGPAWETRLVHDFNRDADVEFPWQQRIGYTCLVGLAMRVSGDSTARVPEAVSTGSSVALVALTGVVAAEYLGPWIAVMAMLFLAVSPLDLALARRAWQDDLMALLTLLMLWAFLRHATRGGRAAIATFFAVSAYALLVKESAVIPFGLGTLGLAYLAWRNSRGARRPLLVLAAGAATALVALGVVVRVSGGWSELQRTLALSREANAPDDYMRNYQTGGVGYYVTGLRLLQPVPFLLGACGALLAVLRAPFLRSRLARPRPGRVLAALGWLVVGFCAVSFSYYSKNMRFLSPIFAAVALLAATLVQAGFSSLRDRVPRPLAVACAWALALALSASALLDARRFDHYFNELQMQDLATPWFTHADQEEK